MFSLAEPILSVAISQLLLYRPTRSTTLGLTVLLRCLEIGWCSLLQQWNCDELECVHCTKF